MIPPEVHALACALADSDDPDSDAISFAWNLVRDLEKRGYRLTKPEDSA